MSTAEKRTPQPDARAATPDGTMSTREVAKFLAVSEATVKRWSDEGLIACQRTPGGHRKFRRHDVGVFMASQHFVPVGAEALLAAPLITRDDVLSVALSGDDRELFRLLSGALARGTPIGVLLDTFIAPALQEIGERWACAGLSVAQEHLASHTITHALTRLAEAVTIEPIHGTAITGCLTGERHEIALLMAAVVLRSRGYRVLSTGADTPEDSLASFIREKRPAIVALSAAYAPPDKGNPIKVVSDAAKDVGARLILGGGQFATISPMPAHAELATNMRGFEAILTRLAGG